MIQHDSHELLEKLVDGLHEGLNVVKKEGKDGKSYHDLVNEEKDKFLNLDEVEPETGLVE